MMSMEEIRKVVETVAEEHITKHGVDLIFTELSHERAAYYVVLTHKRFVLQEQINLLGIPDDIVAEYLHCRIHALAASVLSKLHPLNP